MNRIFKFQSIFFSLIAFEIGTYKFCRQFILHSLCKGGSWEFLAKCLVYLVYYISNNPSHLIHRFLWYHVKTPSSPEFPCQKVLCVKHLVCDWQVTAGVILGQSWPPAGEGKGTFTVYFQVLRKSGNFTSSLLEPIIRKMVVLVAYCVENKT